MKEEADWLGKVIRLPPSYKTEQKLICFYVGVRSTFFPRDKVGRQWQTTLDHNVDVQMIHSSLPIIAARKTWHLIRFSVWVALVSKQIRIYSVVPPSFVLWHFCSGRKRKRLEDTRECGWYFSENSRKATIPSGQFLGGFNHKQSPRSFF